MFIVNDYFLWKAWKLRVEINKDSVVTNFYEKITNPPSNRANGAIYAFDDDLLIGFLKIEILQILVLMWQLKLLGRIYAWHTEELFVDIGTSKA